MRIMIAAAACAATLGIGFAAGRVTPAAAADEHAMHDMSVMGAPMPGFQQSTAIPASSTTAAERIAKSPRHAEWVSIKVNATDSAMAWVVYPERKDKAPVVIAIHENTGINTWTRSVADQLALMDSLGLRLTSPR